MAIPETKRKAREKNFQFTREYNERKIDRNELCLANVIPNVVLLEVYVCNRSESVIHATHK